MHSVLRFLSIGAIAGLACSVSAATVSVNSVVPEVPTVSYQTITAALNYVKTTQEPRIVEIVAGGPYQENLLINFSVTVRGALIRPTVVTPPIAGAPDGTLNGNGIGIYTNAGSGGDIKVRLENMDIIPAVGNAPTRGVRSSNNTGSLSTDDMKIELVNVLLSSNNGSNAAVTTDGLSLTANAGKTSFADDGMFFTGFVDVDTTGVIISNIFNGDAVTNDGLVFFPSDALRTLNIGPGSVFSFMNRAGVQVASDGSIVNIVGTETEPVVFTGNLQGTPVKNAALCIYFDNNSLPDSKVKMENVVFYKNNNTAIATNFIDPADSVVPLTATKVAWVDNADSAVVAIGDIKTPWSFNSVTMVNNVRAPSTSFFEIVNLLEATPGASTGPITFVDSVIAGNGDIGDGTGKNALQFNMPNAAISFTNSAIVTAGPHSLAASPFSLTGGTPTPVQTNVINTDPEFVNADTYPAADFVDVAAATYDNAGTGGSDLSGYGDYVGTGSSVGNWSVY